MTKRETIVEAGKQIAAIASGRARKVEAEEVLNDPDVQRQNDLAPAPGDPAKNKD